MVNGVLNHVIRAEKIGAIGQRYLLVKRVAPPIEITLTAFNRYSGPHAHSTEETEGYALVSPMLESASATVKTRPCW